jgi:hypothetical protein
MADGSPNALSSSFLIPYSSPSAILHSTPAWVRARSINPWHIADTLHYRQVKVKLQRPPTDLGSSLGLDLGLGLGFGLMNDIVPFRTRAYAIIRHISTGMMCACCRFVTCIHPYFFYFIFNVHPYQQPHQQPTQNTLSIHTTYATTDCTTSKFMRTLDCKISRCDYPELSCACTCV